MRAWILPHFFGQISNGLPMAGISKHAGVYLMWYSTRRTSVPSGVLFCKSFERVLHSSVPFHKYFEQPCLLANQLNPNLYIIWPIKIQISKVGALTACKLSNKSNKRLLRYCTFIFALSCRIASVTSYLSENEAENLQNGDVDVAQIPDF